MKVSDEGVLLPENGNPDRAFLKSLRPLFAGSVRYDDPFAHMVKHVVCIAVFSCRQVSVQFRHRSSHTAVFAGAWWKFCCGRSMAVKWIPATRAPAIDKQTRKSTSLDSGVPVNSRFFIVYHPPDVTVIVPCRGETVKNLVSEEKGIPIIRSGIKPDGRRRSGISGESGWQRLSDIRNSRY